MNLKQEHAILALIGLGAVGVFVFLWYESRNASAAAPSTPNEAASPGYPNAAPIQPSTFDVGGSPVNLTYNTFPPDYSATGTQVAPLSSSCGNGGCDGCGSGCDACTQTQQPVTVQSVPPEIMQSAVNEFAAFASKAAPAPAKPAQRVTFTAA